MHNRKLSGMAKAMLVAAIYVGFPLAGSAHDKKLEENIMPMTQASSSMMVTTTDSFDGYRVRE